MRTEIALRLRPTQGASRGVDGDDEVAWQMWWRRPVKPLDRPTYWLWVVPLVLAHLVLTFLIMNGVGGPVGAIDTVLVIYLAVALSRRFRDIGWQPWIGPTILLGLMVGLPTLLFGYAIMNHSGEIMRWFWLMGLVTGPIILVLLVVAGCAPGKPDTNAEAAQVFE
jgi:hypothetical protein